MNGNAMRKKLGPVADDIAMFLSGIDGFPHDLRDFSAVGARTWMSIVGFKMPSHLWQGDCTIGISRNLQREHLRASSLAAVSADSVGSLDSKWLKYMSQDAQGSAVSGKLLYAQVQQLGSSSFIFF